MPDAESERAKFKVPRSFEYAAQLSWRLLVICGAIVVLIWIVVKLRLIVVPIVMGLILANPLIPPCRWLERKGFSRFWASVTVVSGVVLVLIGLALLLVPQLVRELGDLDDLVIAGLRQVEDWLNLERSLTDIILDELQENSASITTGVITGVSLALEIISGAVLALITMFFIVKDRERIVGRILFWTPEHYRDDVLRLGRRAWQTLGDYIKGMAVVAAFDSVLVFIGLLIFQIPLALPLAVLIFFGAFFPMIGAFLAGLVAVLVALVTGGVFDAVIVMLLITGVQILEGQVVLPVVVGRAVHIHPAGVLFALTAGAVIAGILGAFLAVPVAAVITGVVREWTGAPDRGGYEFSEDE